MPNLYQVGHDAISLALQLRAVRVAQIAAVDDVLRDRLCLHRLVAEDAKLNLIALRIEAPMLEGEHGEHPNAAADALHADPFALEVRRRSDALD